MTFYLLFIGKTNALRCFDCKNCPGSLLSNIDDQRIIDCHGYCYVGYFKKFQIIKIISNILMPFFLEKHKFRWKNF